MATIHNPTIRIFHMPRRAGHKPGMLGPHQTIEVPDAYLEALRAEENSHGRLTGWARRLAGDGSAARVVHPSGVEGAFEARILAKRAEARKAQASTTAARVEALENEVTSEKKSASKKAASSKSASKKS